MNILYINSSVRSDSRTALLAEYLLSKLKGSITEIKPHEMSLPAVDEQFICKRNAACASADYSDDIFLPAKQFANADIIVIAAPFWDLSFPAALKQYIEQITVSGITFTYSDEGTPVGLCKAEKLFYVTTSGGPMFSEEFGYGYIKSLAGTFYGITETKMFRAENLDIIGADIGSILAASKKDIDNYFA
jgi:FMN-dependent NADH-azoreductase